MALLYEDETRLLRRCFFDVQNEVGLGRHEEAYQRACEIWLQEKGIPFRSKPSHHICLGDDIAHTIYPDLVAWDSITVELKAVRRRLQNAEFVQILDYLKCRDDRLGLLVNMGLDRVEVRRIVHERRAGNLDEEWGRWEGSIAGPDREVGGRVRTALRNVFAEHGTGYGEEITQKLVRCELNRQALPIVMSPSSKAYFRGKEIHEAPLDCMIVDDRILLTCSSLLDDNNLGINRCKSYLRAMGMTWGVAANFGKQSVQFNSVHVGN